MTVKEQALAERYMEAIQIELHRGGNEENERLFTTAYHILAEADKELWARVVKPQLLLILVTDSDGDNHRITYSGSFTVAWA